MENNTGLPPGRLMRFDELEQGMHVMSPDGVVEIAEAHDVHIPEKMYEIIGEDNEPLKVSGNHLWYIETQNDRSMHSMRLKQGKNVLSDLTDAAYETLEETAFDDTDNIIETSLADMIELVDGFENTEKNAVLTRIAKSIGHIAENDTVIQDISSAEQHRGTTVKMYDAVVFCQQILALTGDRKYRKRWGIKVGQVVTTEDLVHLYDSAELPVVDML